MSSTITHDNLKKIIETQKKFKNDPPVTSRATFKISALGFFLEEIKNLIDFEKSKKIELEKLKKIELEKLKKIKLELKDDELEKLKKIELELKENEPDEMRTHNICITFVREIYLKDKMESDLGYSFSSYTHGEIWKNGLTEDNENFSQLIPIIVGCECYLDDHYKTKSFKFIRNADGLIPFVRPGGEGSGLIPPPPGDDDI